MSVDRDSTAKIIFEFAKPIPRTPTKVRKRRAIEEKGFDVDLGCDEDLRAPQPPISASRRLFIKRARHSDLTALDAQTIQNIMKKLP